MRHLDLFSGIGGFSLAAERVWGEDYECVGFCDINTFAQNSLRKNFPGVHIYGDIRTLTNATNSRVETVHQRREPSVKPLDLLTGGFPCQPFSVAGKQKGKDDDRYLWPEMLRVIREFKPRWIIGENVAGIVNMALEQVCLDLEAEGYEVQPFIIPACAVNAPHRRDRVWIVGHATNNGLNGAKDRESGIERSDRNPSRTNELCQPEGANRLRKTSANTQHLGYVFGEHEGRSRPEKRIFESDSEWSKNWFEIATAVCRVDDGVPKRMARLPDGSYISEARWRQEALKAYGNSIVPLVAEEIMRNIKIVDDFYQVLG